MLPGYATPEGTSRYRDRFPTLKDAQHFRRAEHVPGASGLWLSSMGLGTYLGEADDAADANYTSAIATALRSGINVLDSAINYRHQRSERNIGAALQQLVQTGDSKRDEVFISTKAGYLSFDGNLPADPRAYFQREYISTGILDPQQLAGGMHCIAPKYLEDQLERSRRNLGLETIDLFYLHNPESQISDVTPEVFQQRVKDAFLFLETKVESGAIRFYGMATWNGFRVPDTSSELMNLFDIAKFAREAGGENHHFRFVQLPFNLAMPEAYALSNQKTDEKKTSLLGAAETLGIAVVGSASLFQGKLTRGVPEFVGRTLGTSSDAQSAIQFSRSAPGVMTSLIGMGQAEHVAANLTVAQTPPASPETWVGLFKQAR
jgi:aryl-alcohol dehydrogenase-like predicted oxidoreductase